MSPEFLPDLIPWLMFAAGLSILFGVSGAVVEWWLTLVDWIEELWR